MRIDHPEFRYLRVVRSGGIAGLRDTVIVDATMTASVDRQVGTDHRFELDVDTGDALVQAAARLAARGDAPVGEPRSSCTYRYAIELGWGDRVVRVDVDQLAVDEAIHGVVAVATRLLDARRHLAFA